MADRRRRPFVRLALALAAIVPLIFASACSRETEPSPKPRPASPEPVRGGDFRLSLAGVRTLDPARVSGLNEGAAVRQIFDGLVELDDELRVVPVIATTWEISEDRRTFTFRLRDDVSFHNGRRVEAADFVYSFERLLDPRSESPAAPFLTVIEGSEEFQEGTAEHVSGLVAKDPHRLAITLEEPYQPFLSVLAMHWAKVVPREEVERGEFDARPCGTGPFRFVSRDAKRTLVLAANDGYFRGRPFLDRVTILDLQWEAEYEAFRDGRIDYYAASPAEFDRLSRAGRYILVRRPSLTVALLGLNQNVPVLREEKVRHAIAQLVDRPCLESALDGRAIAATSILPPGMPGYDPSSQGHACDAESAAALLAQAGYPGGEGLPAFRLFVGGLPEQKKICDLLKSQLGRAGIKINVETTEDFERFMRGLEGSDMYIFGWGADFPDPDNFLGPLFITGAPYNFCKYSSPLVDSLVADGRYQADKVARLGLYRRAEKQVLLDAAVIPLFHESALHCLQPDVRGFAISTLGVYQASLREVWKETPPAAEPAR